MNIREWKRSPRGKIFGVATGLAEWRHLDPGMTRLIVFLIVLFTGIFPGAVVYLILAVILPAEGEEKEHYGKHGKYYEASWSESDDSSSAKEDDWERRFRDSEGR